MPVPRQRHTRSRKNKRRATLALRSRGITKCLKCGQPVLPHQVCKNCGTFKGRQVIDVLKKLTKREQKKRQKELKAQEEEAKEGKPLNAAELSK
ncbi:MAG: 50S ribosomal protein L32 [Candidatus Portnoybacteria bacterium]|nr:50S ribosomal protein L32 [Candidatus Portnoybacteria bacterium]